MPRRSGMTPLHQAVLDILVGAGRPLGAYDILAEMSVRAGHRVAPPSVYRALAALIAAGRAIKIESLNAFMADEAAGSVLCVCRRCGGVASLSDHNVERRLLRDTKALGFAIDRRQIELTGTCRNCLPHSAGF